jgi:glycosyltransferase involved in cell wall biosynthesis
VAFVGRLAYQKNLPALLEAVAPLRLRLLLVGDGPLRSELMQQAAHLGVQATWAGQVAHADLPAYLNQAHVFVLPSHYEGHPKTLIEAMACGLPVVGSTIPAIRDVIQPGETGLLCTTDPASIRAALRQLLHDAALRARLGAQARRFAVQTYALEQIVAQELRVLREVVGDDRVAHA